MTIMQRRLREEVYVDDDGRPESIDYEDDSDSNIEKIIEQNRYQFRKNFFNYIENVTD